MHINQSRYYTSYGKDYALTNLLIELSQQYIVLNKQPLATKNSDKMIAEIIEWIRIISLQDLSISQLTGKYGFCSDYVAKLLQKEDGYAYQRICESRQN